MRGIFALALGIPLLLAYYAAGADDRSLDAWEAEHGTIVAGDVLFQDLDCGARCSLIRQVTGSRYVHVGIVLGEGDDRVVWEAYAPVGPTPIAEWVARGKRGEVALYRPRPGTVGSRVAAIERALRTMEGRPYDGDYQWDEDAIYCSELVAKAYREVAGEDVFPPHPVPFGPHASRIAAMSEGRLTSETPMVPPVDLTRHPDLERITDPLAE